MDSVPVVTQEFNIPVPLAKLHKPGLPSPHFIASFALGLTGKSKDTHLRNSFTFSSIGFLGPFTITSMWPSGFVVGIPLVPGLLDNVLIGTVAAAVPEASERGAAHREIRRLSGDWTEQQLARGDRELAREPGHRWS